jgi:hypothetical protein
MLNECAARTCSALRMTTGQRPRCFYYGYLAAKAGIHVIDVSQIDGNIKKVMDRCAAAPNITVPLAFRQALGRRG